MALTLKQKEVFEFIKDYLSKYDVAPTQMEIKEHFGFKSLGSVQDYLKYLMKEGLLENDTNSVRGLRIKQASKVSTATEIPFLGTVAAGKPIDVFEIEELIAIPSHLVGRGEYFALQVKGDSMIEEGIFENDMLVVRSTKVAQDGALVIATVDHQATVKRLSHKKGKIELIPANARLKPIPVQSHQDFQIKGIVVGLFREY